MPEIKIKHIISFSSEDKVHKAENLLKPETYRKWKCATPGEKKAVITLQFEKATKIHSIDIGNECSAFVEVLVGRSSDSTADFQVLLATSSFMTPAESKNETHTNRVRMFNQDALSNNFKDEKWDCAQIVCTQPFNKSISYGLSFVKFHSPPEAVKEVPAEPESKNDVKIGAFKLKSDDDDSTPSVGMWFNKRKESRFDEEVASPAAMREASSYAAAVLAANSNSISKYSHTQVTGSKRKYSFSDKDSYEPPAKKEIISSDGKEKPTQRDRQSPKTEFIIRPKPLERKETTRRDTQSPKAESIIKLKSPDKNKRPGNCVNAVSVTPKQRKRVKISFNKIMDKVVFVLSGFVNPLRSELRDKAIEMGAKYKGDWDSSCTHLICAFLNTPKFNEVQKKGGKIVTKHWINDCHQKKQPLSWRIYMLGKYYGKNSSDETDSDIEIELVKESVTKKNSSPNEKVVKKSPKMNGDSAPKAKLFENKNVKNDIDNADSETEDEDAIRDYLADTDVGSSSGGDTEDEIRKVEEKAARKRLFPDLSSPVKKGDSQKIQTKPDTKDLPLPDLPDFFKNKHFFLYGDFDEKVYHDLERYITAYDGIVENYMSDTVKYVISELKWDKNFDDALTENEDLIFVKPQWIFKCNEVGKCIPYQPFIIIPDT